MVAVAARGLTKRFGATLALDDVSLDIGEREIRALVGENGAGKSTFLGVLTGRVTPSAGSVEVFASPLPFGNPRRARAAGIVAIYQELMIVPARSAMQNVFIAATRRRAGAFVDERAMRRRYDELCERLGVSIPARTPARELSVADQQSLEIMRALDVDARLMLLDEPTAALAPAERQRLFRTMRELKHQGVTMVLVSHNLDEVLDVADRATVFRDGAVVADAAVSEWTKARLVQAMLGRRQDAWEAKPPRGEETGRELLRAERIDVPGAVAGVDLRVHEGEIVGLGGLVGSGRTSVLRALAGLEPASSGRLWIDGERCRWPRSPRQALGYGIALVPEDRKTQGLVPGLTAMANITLSDLGSVARYGLVSKRAMRRRARELAAAYGFAGDRVGEVARNLSGGNQQKLLLARWAHRRPRVLLCDEPTRGVDVGAKAEILETLRRLAADGLGVLMVSSELEELEAVSARVTVLSEGRAVAELGEDDGGVSVERILSAAFGVEEAA